MTDSSPSRNWLTGRLLITMPHLAAGSAPQSVIYVCIQNQRGSMGLVLNDLIDDLAFSNILDWTGMPRPADAVPIDIPVRRGGPTQLHSGLVLHSSDYHDDGTITVDDRTLLTGTRDILRAIVEGRGPQRRLFALGHCAWPPGELESAVNGNAWLCLEATDDLVFSDETKTLWKRAISSVAPSAASISPFVGRA